MLKKCIVIITITKFSHLTGYQLSDLMGQYYRTVHTMHKRMCKLDSMHHCTHLNALLFHF